uniref:Uncharacterized protein n=1 Tax=Chloropicon primus TaxID=1764295 RepID=A0A7S2X1T7_9CHLO
MYTGTPTRMNPASTVNVLSTPELPPPARSSPPLRPSISLWSCCISPFLRDSSSGKIILFFLSPIITTLRSSSSCVIQLMVAVVIGVQKCSFTASVSHTFRSQYQASTSWGTLARKEEPCRIRFSCATLRRQKRRGKSARQRMNQGRAGVEGAQKGIVPQLSYKSPTPRSPRRKLSFVRPLLRQGST